MSLDVLVAEMLALGPVEATAASQRSAESLALVRARAAESVPAAERVPADPEANTDHGTVRAAARVLADPPADRCRSSAGAATNAMEKP